MLGKTKCCLLKAVCMNIRNAEQKGVTEMTVIFRGNLGEPGKNAHESYVAQGCDSENCRCDF